MVVRAIGAVLLVVSTMLGACSGKTQDEGAGGASNQDEPSPVEQCQDYASTWCNKAFSCYVQVGRLDQDSLQSNVDQCIQVIEDRLPCSGVTSVTSDYAKCLSQIKGMACSRWNVPQTQFATVTPPSICAEVLSF